MKTCVCVVILLVFPWGEINARAANPKLTAIGGSIVAGQSGSFSLLTQGRRTPAIGKNEVIIRAELSKRSAYVGEEVLLTYRLFTSVPIMALELLEEPSLTGFWVENVELPEDQRPERRTLEGKDYSVLPVRQQVLFPTTPGKIEIGRARFSVAVRSRSGDPFDAFIMRVSKPIVREAGPLSLEVKRLPTEGRPRDFSGAVGEYSLEAELNKEEVEAGDPVTLTLSVRGQGNLRSVKAPGFLVLPGFRHFDPSTSENLRASSTGFYGTKLWEFVLVPDAGGLKEIGPWSFRYFDPKQKRYLTASAGPLRLSVAGAAITAGIGPVATRRGDVKLLGKDIRFLKEPPETLGVATSPYYRSSLFYLSLVLPILWNLGFVFHLRRKEKERTHGHVFRRQRARGIAGGSLERAGKLAQEASKEFYEEVAVALYRYIGDKTAASPSGLTNEGIDALLEERETPPGLRKEFLTVLGKCEEARFTPGERTRDEMQRLRHRAEELIVSLEKYLG